MSKLAVFELIDQNEAELKSMASTIWEYAETAMKEFRSAKLQRIILPIGFVIREIPTSHFVYRRVWIGRNHRHPGRIYAMPTMSQKIQAPAGSEAVRTGTAAATTCWEPPA
jgi:hypothetical protein